jgi:hypothetical protein
LPPQGTDGARSIDRHASRHHWAPHAGSLAICRSPDLGCRGSCVCASCLGSVPTYQPRALRSIALRSKPLLTSGLLRIARRPWASSVRPDSCAHRQRALQSVDRANFAIGLVSRRSTAVPSIASWGQVDRTARADDGAWRPGARCRLGRCSIPKPEPRVIATRLQPSAHLPALHDLRAVPT